MAPMADSQAWPQPATQEGGADDDEGHAPMEIGGDDGYEGSPGFQDDGSDADNGYQAGVQLPLAAASVTPDSIWLSQAELSISRGMGFLFPLREGRYSSMHVCMHMDMDIEPHFQGLYFSNPVCCRLWRARGGFGHRHSTGCAAHPGA